VPIIAVFTKYEQFKRDVRMKLEDGSQGLHTGLTKADVEAEVERVFGEEYRKLIEEDMPYVRLESKSIFNSWYAVSKHSLEMHKDGADCLELINETAKALDEATLMMLLLTVQRDNLDLSVRLAVGRYILRTRDDVKIADFGFRCYDRFSEGAQDQELILQCLHPFVTLWVIS
jgi:hypothetical protein